MYFCRPTQCVGAEFAMATWLSVCLSRWCIVPKRLSWSLCDLLQNSHFSFPIPNMNAMPLSKGVTWNGVHVYSMLGIRRAQASGGLSAISTAIWHVDTSSGRVYTSKSSGQGQGQGHGRKSKKRSWLAFNSFVLPYLLARAPCVNVTSCPQEMSSCFIVL